MATPRCPHCHKPQDTGVLHSWCYRETRWGQTTSPKMIQCGPQCSHKRGADHGVYCGSSGSVTRIARVHGWYPEGSVEMPITSRWDTA